MSRDAHEDSTSAPGPLPESRNEAAAAAENLARLGQALTKKYVEGELGVLASNLSKSFEPLSRMLADLARSQLFEAYRASLSPQQYFRDAVEAPSSYSPQMDSPGRYFAQFEGEIRSVDDLNKAISTLLSKTRGIPLVWRGQGDASWGLHSGLFRQLMKENGVKSPGAKGATGTQPYPDEDQMVRAEREILRVARSDWRFDNLSALELFARIQHAGGPTRLIDVSRNPYVAAWFAVEANDDTDGADARLFALATRPVPKQGQEAATDSILTLDDVGGGREPFWHLLETTEDRRNFDWGTGSRRRIWVPPAYDPRISAQNAAFVLDGVPTTTKNTAAYFRIKGESGAYWSRADKLAAASIVAKLNLPARAPTFNAPQFAPTFSFRIVKSAKEPIRDFMESSFGYRRSYIYPDFAALAGHLKSSRLG